MRFVRRLGPVLQHRAAVLRSSRFGKYKAQGDFSGETINTRTLTNGTYLCVSLMTRGQSRYLPLELCVVLGVCKSTKIACLSGKVDGT